MFRSPIEDDIIHTLKTFHRMICKKAHEHFYGA